MNTRRFSARRICGPVTAMVLAATLSALPALAQVSDADRATARALALEGQTALEKKDWATAADRFGRADSIVHAPTLLLGVARAQVGQGKLVSGQETYNRILREGVAAGAPPAFAKALEDARKEVDALASRVPYVTIVIRGSAAAQVTLDGTAVPSAALGVKRPADPGRHAIRASAEGMAPAEVSVTLGEGKSETVTIELKPAGAAPVIAPVGPVIAPPVADKPADAPPADKPATDAKPKGSLQKTLGFVALGVGGAGLVMGGVTGGLAVGKHGSLADQCKGGKCPASAQADLDGYHLMSTLSTVGFVVGGAGAVAGLVLVLTAPKNKPKDAARSGLSITPLLGPGFVGAEGSF